MTHDVPVDQTICCLATPRGKGAIATIIVHGPVAISVVDKCFRARNAESIAATRRQVRYGNWLSGGQIGEDVIVCVVNDCCVEIHGHGGIASVEAILQELLRMGIREVDGRLMAKRSEGDQLAGDLSMILAQAPTERTARILLHQRSAYTKLLSQVGTALGANDRQLALQILDRSLNFRRFSQHLVNPWSVVLCGPSNVGKSSLINAILGFQRTIVHHLPGTTRDVVMHTTALDGWPVKLSDTAGLRSGADEIENTGIELANEQIKQADLVIVVLDITQSWREQVSGLGKSRARIVALNKSDLLPDKSQIHDDARCAGTQFRYLTNLAAKCHGDFVQHNPFGCADPNSMEVVCVSAKTGLGLDALIRQIVVQLVPQTPAPHEALPILERQVAYLAKFRDTIQTSIENEKSKV
jgi:tRNA modification GTPase